ncbi:hypothetical protein BU26DRAFT_564760 [Trematosphaeria pertusa]|uniref:Uncharacterized protein n=1 Tax=Trematosphaeria pertusa TaxID=390896 RepID=A0A6A6IFV8_9PLEO|nr:uncharacterized protein BU26DRAFT_564760 [Trematosphaeria pertusa]KAF2249079.1 hypothetical protein BU26DRAFT_564760 [Trematosphaeria pertusa]
MASPPQWPLALSTPNIILMLGLTYIWPSPTLGLHLPLAFTSHLHIDTLP